MLPWSLLHVRVHHIQMITSICLDLEWKEEFLHKLYISCTNPNSCRNLFNHNISLHASMAPIYPSSIVDNATPPTKIIRYPDVDFLESMSPTMSASIYPSNTVWLSPNFRQTLEVPLKYRKIHFTTFKLYFPRCKGERLTTPTTYQASCIP